MNDFEEIAQRLSVLEKRVERLEQEMHSDGQSEPGGTGTLNDAQRKAFYNGLSERERAVVREIMLCQSNMQIANVLCVSKGTVANYLTTIYDKLESLGLFGNSKVDREVVIRFMGDYLDRYPMPIKRVEHE